LFYPIQAKKLDPASLASLVSFVVIMQYFMLNI